MTKETDKQRPRHIWPDDILAPVLATVALMLVVIFASALWSVSAASGPDGSVTGAQHSAHKKAAKKADRYSRIARPRVIFSWVKGLTRFRHRRTGTAQGRDSSRYLRKKFKSFGIRDTKIQLARSENWKPAKWSLKVGGESIDSFPVWNSFRAANGFGRFTTGTSGLNAPLVDVRDGTESNFAARDVKGKIVVFNLRFLFPASIFQAMADWTYDPNNDLATEDLSKANPYQTNQTAVMERAEKAGAVGIVGVLSDYFNSNKYIPEHFPTSLPGLWVTKSAGSRIRLLIARGGSENANFRLSGELARGPSRTVIATLPGRSRDAIVIQCNKDAVWKGGVQDASGSSVVLALAKYYSRLPRKKRPKTLMFVLTDSHFSGYQGHEAFMRKYVDNPRAKHRIVANVTVEHIAKQSAVNPDGTLKVYNNKPEVRAVFYKNVNESIQKSIQSSIIRNNLVRTSVIDFAGPTDAAYFFDAGFPTISFISGPMYLYDKVDTIDKVYKKDLRPVARAFAQVTDAVMQTPSSKIGSEITP